MELSITLIIVIITCLVSIGGFSNQKIIDDLIFYPPSVARGQYYRFFTHGLIHADVAHLAFNMIALYSFGEVLEKVVFTHACYFGMRGPVFYVILYLGGLLFASIPDQIKYRNSYQFRSLGASGAVTAVIFGNVILLPKMGIGFPFIPNLSIPGYIYGVLYLGVSAYLDKRGGGHINHSAHLWGGLFGLAFTIIMVSVFGHVNVWDNFIEQMQASRPFLPYCDR